MASDPAQRRFFVGANYFAKFGSMVCHRRHGLEKRSQNGTKLDQNSMLSLGIVRASR